MNTDSPSAANAPRFYPWRDAYGNEHHDIPRCTGTTRSHRSPWSKYARDCKRKGVVQRGSYGDREAWYCLQHDPARKDEKRVADLGPSLLELVAEALALVPRTKRTSDWHRRAEAAITKAEGRRVPAEDGGPTR